MNAGRSPRASVIVVSYNRSGDLRTALDALLATQYPNLEIVVVDNASTDDAAEVAASFHDVRLIRSSENLGFSEGNNLGLAQATGDYVALVNADAVVEPSWIAELVAFLEQHPDAGAAGGKAYVWNDEHAVGARTGPYYSYTTIDLATCLPQAHMDTTDEVREVATLSGCAVMIRKRAVEDVGAPFLEPAFFAYYEETDFFARAIRKGWHLYYVGRPAVWHRIRASSAPERYFFYMQRNRVLFAHRNLGPTSFQAFMESERKDGRFDAWRRMGRVLRSSSEAERGKRDARRWEKANRALLERHRAASENAKDDRYERAVTGIQSRAGDGTSTSVGSPTVSIVIPNYNHGRFVCDAIDSALAQSCSSVEVIVVDDGSTDDSLARIQAHSAGRDDWRRSVRMIEQPNSGVVRARNRGAEAATGSHLVFLDADDVLEPSYVEACLGALSAAPASVAYAYTQMQHFGSDSSVFESLAFDRRVLLRTNFIHASALMRRSVFEDVGRWNVDFEPGLEDHELWVRMLSHGYTGVFVPRPLLRYRRHGKGRNDLDRGQLRALRADIAVRYPSLYGWRLFALAHATLPAVYRLYRRRSRRA